jgi:TMEM175 potassium channel family protein
MTKGRLEAFSDGVLAIIITIMVLEAKVPHGDASLAALWPIAPVFVSYGLSFLYLAIYWNNHHHMFHATSKVDGRVLWANMNLLFWLSLVPFATGWMGENHFASWPTVLYGVVLLLAAIAYFILELALVAVNGRNSALARAIGRDVKGKASIALYAVALALAFFAGWLALLVYALVALMWLVPDRRIERTLAARE